jgi:hypothetical protein
MAARPRGRRSSHGIDGPILEISVGSAGKVLETDMRDARRRKAEVWNVASGAGAIQSRTTGTQEGFPRCRTPGEATGGPGVDFEFCTRYRATTVADGDTQEVPVEVRSNTTAEPIGVSSGRGAYQVVQSLLRSAGPQCPFAVCTPMPTTSPGRMLAGSTWTRVSSTIAGSP